MNFEQLPTEEESSGGQESEITFENMKAKTVASSLFALGLLTGCDMDKITEPEKNTTIITIQGGIEKKINKGRIHFQQCAPTEHTEGGKKIETHLSTLFIEDANNPGDDGISNFYGARFIRNEIEGEEGTISAIFFENKPDIRNNPCAMKIIEKTGRISEYESVINALNTGINILTALKLTVPQESPEFMGARVEVLRLQTYLEKVFGPNSYNKDVVEKILK